ncbi:MAG: hypothetical protein ACRCRP_01400 [Metamycoplasmataceae bacterium]
MSCKNSCKIKEEKNCLKKCDSCSSNDKSEKCTKKDCCKDSCCK